MQMNRISLIVLVLVATVGAGGIALLFLRPRNGIGRPSGGAAALRPERQIVNVSPSLDGEPDATNLLAGLKVSTGNAATTSNPSETFDLWSRFRGVDGKGISHDKTIPTQWNDSQNVLWKSKMPGSGSSSPILTSTQVFVTSYSGYGDQGLYFCANAKNGELVQKKRVSGIQAKGRPVYASPIAIDGKLYMQTRNSGLFVLAGEPELQILHQNRLESDESVFNATPAVSRGQLFLRSNAYLYCIGSQRSN